MGDAAMWAWGPAGHSHVSIMSGQAPTLSRVEQRLARFLILAHWQQLDRSFTFVYSPFDPLPFSICYICTRKAGTDTVVSEDCDSCWLILIVVMQCLQSPVAHLSVLERQRFSSRWQQHGQEQPSHHSYSSAADLCVQGLNPFDCFSNGLPNLPQYSLAAAPNFEETSVAVSDSSSRKRKAETSPQSKQDLGKVESDCKRVKQETGGGGARSESKQQNSGKEASGESSKKDEETPKTDYIHVRARRGQATDSHSLAERVRRERISQRMKYLQELVPGCSKITGKAGMLDEIINYVQSLQRQVEFLSMKLAAVNPMAADIDFSSGETMTQLVHINPPSRSSSMGISSELMDLQPFLHFDSLQLHPCSGMDMYMDSSDLVPDGSSFGSCSALNGLYRVEFQLGRGTAAFPFQSLQGNLLPNNVKMEI